MNLFLLSTDPKECTFLLSDVHVVKMILETVQMLFSAWLLGKTKLDQCNGTKASSRVNDFKNTN